MAMLIRQAMMHTQTLQGAFQGDIMIRDGRIQMLGRHIDVDEQTMEHIIDAHGLHLCPGLIDTHIHLIRAGEKLETDLRAIARSALSAGVTSMALWQESGNECLLRHGSEAAQAKRIICVNAESIRDDVLVQVMQNTRARKERMACEIHGEKTLRRVLRAQEQTGCEVILAHLVDCFHLTEEIIASGCPVILGACIRRGKGNVYALAAALQKTGVTVALTCDHPAVSLHYLPMHAGLCMKEGLAPEEALRTVTLDAARLMGIDEQTGSIDVGKRADLTLYDGLPLLMSSSRVLTVCNGELV